MRIQNRRVDIEIHKKYSEKIINIKICNDIYIDRVRIKFENGYGISIVKGSKTQGGEDDLFEIAPLDNHGNLNGKLIGFENDDVLGYLTKDDVNEIIKQITNL